MIMSFSTARGLALGYSYKITTVSSLVDSKQASKFVHAVEENDVKTLHKMIKKGFDINVLLRFESGMEKMSALHFAAREGFVEAVREMVKSACDVNIKTPFDLSTPLVLACQHVAHRPSLLAITYELLVGGADANLGDHWGRTPLIFASEQGNHELVDLLLNNGANPDQQFDQEDHPDGVRHALKVISLSSTETDEMRDPYVMNSPLMQACREHHLTIVKYLLKHNCDINLTNCMDNTALHIACKSESRSTYTEHLTRAPVAGSPEIVQCLLARPDCQLDALNKHDDTPLKRAIDGIQEVAVWNIPIEDKIAQAKNFADIVNLLITAGCCVTRLYNESESALGSLLKVLATVQPWDSQSVTSKILVCIRSILLAGASPTDANMIAASHCPSARPIFPLFEEMNHRRPPRLKHLCKVAVRALCRHPGSTNFSKLDLPKYLQQYLALEMIG